MIFVGDVWSEAHHDVCLLDEAGTKLAAWRLPEGLAGVARLHEMVAEHASDPGEVVVGDGDCPSRIVACGLAHWWLRAIWCMRSTRWRCPGWRDRHSLGGAKSDRADAKLLADLVRTDGHNHRPVAGDSPGAEGIKIVAGQSASEPRHLIWDYRQGASYQPVTQRSARVLSRSPGNVWGPGTSRRCGYPGSGTHPQHRGSAEASGLGSDRPPPRSGQRSKAPDGDAPSMRLPAKYKRASEEPSSPHRGRLRTPMGRPSPHW